MHNFVPTADRGAEWRRQLQNMNFFCGRENNAITTVPYHKRMPYNMIVIFGSHQVKKNLFMGLGIILESMTPIVKKSPVLSFYFYFYVSNEQRKT